MCLLMLGLGFFLGGHFTEYGGPNAREGKLRWCAFNACWVAIGFALDWNLPPIALLTAFFWFWYCANCVKKSDDITLVARASKMCVGIGLAVFQITKAFGVLAVYSTGANEENIWVSPLLSHG